MSSKTKIVVLRMKEIIYTAIFIGLAIFLILLFFFMFRSEKEAPAPTAESASPAVYAPGVDLGLLIPGPPERKRGGGREPREAA